MAGKSKHRRKSNRPSGRGEGCFRNDFGGRSLNDFRNDRPYMSIEEKRDTKKKKNRE